MSTNLYVFLVYKHNHFYHALAFLYAILLSKQLLSKNWKSINCFYMECNEAVHKYRGLSVCVFFAAFGSGLSLSVWLWSGLILSTEGLQGLDSL